MLTRTEQEAVAEAVERLKGLIANEFASNEGVPPFTTMLCRRGPDGKALPAGKLGKAIIPAPPGNFGQEEKEAYAHAVKSLAQKFQAAAVLFVSECWMLKRESMTAEDRLKWHEGSEEEWADRLTGGIPVRDHPDKIEAVMMSVETEDGFEERWSCPIARDEKGHPTLGEWERFDESTAGSSRGRFTGLCPVPTKARA